MPRKLTIKEVEKRIKEKNPNLSIVRETYVNTMTKCLFIEEGYGEFWCRVNDIFSGNTQGHPIKKRSRIKKTCLEKYGVENPLQNKEIQEKIKKTCLKKYGTKNPLQNKEIREKQKQTCLKNHGVEHHSQKKEISLKAAKTQNNSQILFHWKTNEELICIASYEIKTVEYLNSNKIEYLWQPEVFKLSNNTTYRPDLYLINEDKYIEIKGYFREKSKIKWELFQILKPNSELWDKKKLKELKIL